MCGIAGYSVGNESQIDRTLAAQALLAGIAERGADAVGYAVRADGPLTVHKQQTGASAMLDTIVFPQSARQALVHVRDYTKGHPTISANNHPVRHGSVVGIHNGIIENDDEIFARYGLTREHPEMTVDSEAIFALAEARDNDASALEELYGAMASAWMDEREPDVVFLARGVGRPLWVGKGSREVFFASTRDALEIVERALRIGFRKTEIAEGRLLRLEGGHVVSQQRFHPDRSFREQAPLPPVRAPHEGASCLARLAVLASLG
jgi:glucosamine 6-phosphate synthetase-like amidotransferase/phosphosugar isomerase protein